MKKGINCICWARICMPCGHEMEQTIYLVRYRGEPKKNTVCERCGKITMTHKYQYTMKGEEILRRGIKETDPPC